VAQAVQAQPARQQLAQRVHAGVAAAGRLRRRRRRRRAESRMRNSRAGASAHGTGHSGNCLGGARISVRARPSRAAR